MFYIKLWILITIFITAEKVILGGDLDTNEITNPECNEKLDIIFKDSFEYTMKPLQDLLTEANVKTDVKQYTLNTEGIMLLLNGVYNYIEKNWRRRMFPFGRYETIVPEKWMDVSNVLAKCAQMEEGSAQELVESNIYSIPRLRFLCAQCSDEGPSIELSRIASVKEYLRKSVADRFSIPLVTVRCNLEMQLQKCNLYISGKKPECEVTEFFVTRHACVVLGLNEKSEVAIGYFPHYIESYSRTESGVYQHVSYTDILFLEYREVFK